MHFVTTDSGVHINPKEIRANKTVEVTYEGLLANSGAQEVYAHFGSAYLADWAEVQDVKMQKSSNGAFSTNIKVPEGNTFHICFHDNAYNWDNNNGSNYSFAIEE